MGTIIGKIQEANGSLTYQYQTDSEVCSQMITITLEGDTIEKVQYVGGCSGNTQGVAALVKGMSIDEAISRLQGIRCGRKNTSCPDQLAKALISIK
jgi:uncharacterized protein (TIGR03905 family)